MSDNEIFEIEEDNAKVFIPKSKNKANANKKKAKAGMTEERKAKLLEQLARGRATSALNRAKKAKVKKIKKQEELTEQDEIIYKDIEKKKNKKSKREIELEDELNKLKKKTKKPLSPLKEEEEDDLFSEGSDMEVILTEDEPKKQTKQHVKIRFNEKTKRLADSSDDDEEIEKQIQKLQAKKKNKKSKNQSSSSIQKPIIKSQPIDVQPVMNKKPKAWEVAHLWK